MRVLGADHFGQFPDDGGGLRGCLPVALFLPRGQQVRPTTTKKNKKKKKQKKKKKKNLM